MQHAELAGSRAAFGIDQIEQHVEQQEGEIAAAMCPRAQIGHGRLRIELGCLAEVELLDGHLAQLGIQAQAVHLGFGGADFNFGDAPVRFRQGAGECEQRRDERCRMRRTP